MTLLSSRISALRASSRLILAILVSSLAVSAFAQNRQPASAPASPYGGTVVEQAVARVNDQIISTSDYDRSMKEMDDAARQRGETMQQIADGHKELLRNLIDQQLWLSKGKELGITGDNELIKQLDEIRKKYNLATMEDLEKAAREQGASFEDFKAGLRNQIITSQVIRDEVGRHVSATPGEVQRYFEAHKSDYIQPESIQLHEILISTGADGAGADDPAKIATAKAKADDIEAKLKAGEDFDKLARASSDGPTAAQGGDLGKFGPGGLNKVFEDATSPLTAGQYTAPIRTKQGFVIFKVVDHVRGGVPQYKDVQDQVEQTFYESRMEPAMRTYLARMREDAYIVLRPGYTDTAATANELKPSITNSAYVPPAPKKKKKVQRTRFRETEHSFRNKSSQTASAPPLPEATPAKPGSPSSATTASTASSAKTKTVASATPSTMKAGKKEKIRYGQAPRETLPNSADTKVEDAGALPKAANVEEADNSNQPAAPVKKSRYSERMKLPKDAKSKGPALDNFTPAPADAAELADRQTQSQPLGLAGDNTNNKKKKKTATAAATEKTRMQERPKAATDNQPLVATPAAPAAGAPAPAKTPSPIQAPVPSSAPQQTPTSPDPPQSNVPASEPPH